MRYLSVTKQLKEKNINKDIIIYSKKQFFSENYFALLIFGVLKPSPFTNPIILHWYAGI
jgi:hypothetical protein